MSLKQEIETWVAALAAYDNNEFDVSIKTFETIADTSKILFNCGVIHATLGEHEKAVNFYMRAIRLDQYLAVAYFQQGVSNFLMGDFEEALANFNDTLLYLRGNNNIDYEQLGLKFKLYSCEVLFNRGLCYIYLQQLDAGMQDLNFAAKEKVVPDHDVIDEAIREQAEGYTVFSIPVGIVYRPNEAKVKNLATKDYLGKARLVAATDRNNAFTGFQGSELRNRNILLMARDDRDVDKISYAATHLVKANLRSRQQSEPPIGRNVFPPTPPPEVDAKPSPSKDGPAASARGDAVKAGATAKVRPLDLSVAGFEKPRLGTVRSASERPRGTRERELERHRERRSNGSDRAPTLQERRQQRKQSEAEDRAPSPEEVYDMYGASSNGVAGGRRQKPAPTGRITYIEEEDEDGDEEYDDGYNEDDFEMLPPATGRSARSARSEQSSSHRYTGASSSSAASSGARRHHQHQQQQEVKMSRIRVKVHAEDTRYVLIHPAVGFPEFVDQIRAKFGLRMAFKIKIRDEEDFVTMADRDDLDMAVQNSRAEARRQRAEMGKMEVWIQEVI